MGPASPGPMTHPMRSSRWNGTSTRVPATGAAPVTVYVNVRWMGSGSATSTLRRSRAVNL
jgi:hypothetical protein